MTAIAIIKRTEITGEIARIDLLILVIFSQLNYSPFLPLNPLNIILCCNSVKPGNRQVAI